jgi:hypothetical protein
VLEDESPYPEVRSAVANTDDPKMPSSTIRAWVVGLFWAVVLPGVNQFFFFRFPSIGISQVCETFPHGVSVSLLGSQLLNRILRDKYIPMLLSLPICKAWARYLPNICFFGIPLNPGPFTIKEHVIIAIMAGVGDAPAYAVSVAPTWQIMSGLFRSARVLTISFRPMLSPFRKSFTISTPHLPVSYRASSAHPLGLLIDFTNHKTDQWLLVMSTQLIGFSIGGICKRFFVAPPSMIWPDSLLSAVLFNTLHGQETSGTQARGGTSRLRFFYYVFIGYIFYSQSFSGFCFLSWHRF